MYELNEQQKEAADFMFGVASVIAIPGSGKTLTMTTRIANLIRNGIAPEQILGLTFTRNAAQAMKDKLRSVLNDKVSNVTLTTIHAFCHRILRDEGRTFEMLFGKRQFQLIQNVMKKNRIESVTAGDALREINLAKSRLISPDRFPAIYGDNETMLAVADIYEKYEIEKRMRLLFDFDDLLMGAHGILMEHEDICDRYRQTFPHILVDEYQDTNPAQMEILNLLAGNGDQSSFWICGDDWQSIYGFTGAAVENILDFAKDHPESAQFILDINYRSTPQIVEACQRLISHNDKKIDKTLNTINQDGENVMVLDGISEADEAKKVVVEIKDLVERRGFNHTDIAILYRANCQSRAIEEAFSKHDIPYWIEKKAGFYHRHEVNIILNYLWLINDPNSRRGDDAFKVIINEPNRYIGHSFIRDLEIYTEEHEMHLYEGLKSMPVEIPYLRKSIRRFTELIDRFLQEKNWMEPVDIIYLVRSGLDFDKHISNDVADPLDVQDDSLDQLQRAAGNHPTLSGFLEYTETIRHGSGDDENGVSLMTVHKAKGLEFPVVFIIGLIEGVMPNANGNNEEERRIAFVAMSRAMKILYLSYSGRYIGRTSDPSSFITEALSRKEV
jgi:DNA helicase-2/ATP-dependent DNA helicase PcrA